MRIADIQACEALDSRGNPTVACRVTLDDGTQAEAIAPAGASTGSHEALELRDGDQRYNGMGVRDALRIVADVIRDALIGHDPSDLAGVDARLRDLDSTPNFAQLGANATLPVSVATAKAAAASSRVPLYRHLGDGLSPLLPMPMVNILSGGVHAGNAIDIQDVLAIPLTAPTFAEALHMVWQVRRATTELASRKGLAASLVADEGGLGLSLEANDAALELVTFAIERAGYVPGHDVSLAIDVAANVFHRRGLYELRAGDHTWSARELMDELDRWIATYPVISIEDPLFEDDWPSWQEASGRWNSRIQLVADDLVVTNRKRLQRAIDLGVANAVLVKPNQTGTLSHAYEVVQLARRHRYATVVSARSGDTEEAWLSDIAVAWRTEQIKVGSTMRSERTAKWNRLLAIEADNSSSELARPSLLTRAMLID